MQAEKLKRRAHHFAPSLEGPTVLKELDGLLFLGLGLIVEQVGEELQVGMSGWLWRVVGITGLLEDVDQRLSLMVAGRVAVSKKGEVLRGEKVRILRGEKVIKSM